MRNRLEKRNIISLSDLAISENRMPFKKQEKYLWGVDLEKNRLNNYDKGWYWDTESMSWFRKLLFHCFIIAFLI